MSWEFLARFLSIAVLDLTLAGDNAVVIAMAVRSLPAPLGGTVVGVEGGMDARSWRLDAGYRCESRH